MSPRRSAATRAASSSSDGSKSGASKRDQKEGAMKALVAGIAVVAVLTGGASAQPLHDHLQCFRVSDPLALSGIVDVDASPIANQLGCRLGKGRYFCAPASKTVISSNYGILDMPGRELSDDRICYKLRCPKPYP